jgi:hypothetical protein
MERFHPCELGPQVGLAWHIGEVAMSLHYVALAVQAEDLSPSRCRLDQTEEEADRRRLPRPVRTEVADHFAQPDLQVQIA